MPKFSILSVDDDKHTQALIKEVLSSEHVVSLVSSGEKCLHYIKNHIPDLILLDVSMPPGMNGFETCKKIKENEQLHNIPVIFVSGQSSESERLKGYESGGTDYILKPFEIENLREKVSLNLELARQNKDKLKLQRSLSNSNQSAIHALNYSNDLNLVIQYYENCHKFNSTDVIARKILSITTELGLRVVIQIRVNDATHEYSDFGIVTPLERQVILEKFDSGMFYQMHGHLMVNHSNISILIKNMPTQNDSSQEISYEKLQETLRALSYAANKCVSRLIKKYDANKLIAETDSDDLVEVMILKVQNICEAYQSKTVTSLEEVISLLALLKEDKKSESVQKELYKIIKSSKSKSKKIKDEILDTKKIKKEIEHLLEMINH
ncbi:MAG: PleD family two-component system response regulator [Gammaproteobacteria bacterium]